MAQIFRPRANSFIRIGLLAGLLILFLPLLIAMAYVRSPYFTGVGKAPEQPVPFSHEHHVSGLGIDCRYCHNSVEHAAFAGIPATEICMTCHSQIWTNAAMLEPVRESWRDNRPLRWTRVHDLPDYVYFHHGIHVNHGVGCTSCHGPVGSMPLMRKAETLFMSWCLDCHRHPERQLRPKEQVFDPRWSPPANQEEVGKRLVAEYQVRGREITECYTCHR